MIAHGDFRPMRDQGIASESSLQHYAAEIDQIRHHDRSRIRYCGYEGFATLCAMTGLGPESNSELNYSFARWESSDVSGSCAHGREQVSHARMTFAGR